LIDNLMIGGLGELALNAVGVSAQMFFVFWMLVFGFTSGNATFMAQFFGAKDYVNIRRTTGFALTVNFCMGCLFFLVILIPCLFLFAPFLFAAFEVIGHIFEVITSALKPPDDDDFPTAPPSDRD
jgi:Na+-driven multidrug efflux pump